ncbi:MAG: hypothetical protein OHK0046_30790 [Anaerolineae bacterium]
MVIMNSEKRKSPPHFVSLRWRLMTPVFFVVLLVAAGGAYLVGQNMSGGLSIPQDNLLLQSSRAVSDRAARLYDYHREEAQRAAFTIGVPEAVRDNRPEALEPLLESLISLNGLDVLAVTDLAGREVLGVQRVDGQRDYALSTDTDLSREALVLAVLDEAFVGATGLLRTPAGVMLFTAVPIRLGDQTVGVAMVGQRLAAVLADLQETALAELTLYGPENALLHTTFTPEVNALTLAPEVYNQALLSVQQVPVQAVQINNTAYQAAYQPFIFGPNTLGVVAALMPDNIPFVTETGRQLTALFAASLAAAVVIVTYGGLNRVSQRAQLVARTAGKLSVGQRTARTQMTPKDEIGAAGYALDLYANAVARREAKLVHALRRQRREINHLVSVLEALPYGAIVQAMDGRVLFMNTLARETLGSHRVFRSSGLDELAQVVTDKLGAAIAPGIYTLGDPHRVRFDERILSAQAAAVMSSVTRLGTVILIRDITDEVRRERERQAALQRLTREIQQPLMQLGQLGIRIESDMVRAFAREMTRQAVALQKMIVELRELDLVDGLERYQEPIRLDTLIWAVANEWRQIALASDLTMHVVVERKGLYVLGDEERLRWAIGNLVDNAIKYTPTGGALALEINGEEGGYAYLRVRDNGVGIAKEDRQYLFTRFYRGNPTTEDGQPLVVPGMGQGLYITRQIIEAHGGAIQIKSSVGAGTAVYFTLPLTASESLELPDEMDGETAQIREEVFARRRR